MVGGQFSLKKGAFKLDPLRSLGRDELRLVLSGSSLRGATGRKDEL